MRDQAVKLRLYIASPLFNEAERSFNIALAEILEAFFDVFLPQRDGGLMANLIKQGMNPNLAAMQVFQADINAMTNCDILLAVLDGHSIDEGVAFELGFAFANGKKCVGLQTDIRRILPTGNNPMIDQSLQLVFNSIVELTNWAKEFRKTDHFYLSLTNTDSTNTD